MIDECDKQWFEEKEKIISKNHIIRLGNGLIIYTHNALHKMVYLKNDWLTQERIWLPRKMFRMFKINYILKNMKRGITI
jgi:hypothetical protein